MSTLTAQSAMVVRFKKMHPDAVVPTYAHPDGEDNGLDLRAVAVRETDDFIEYNTGIAVEIPRGFTGFVVPNSRVSKYDLVMCNAPGVIDPGYRGAILVRYKKLHHGPANKGAYNAYNAGEVVAQLVIVPAPFIMPMAVDELTPTQRGADGWGSTASNTK